MKFLFSQDHSFTPEKFGRVLFVEVQREKPDGVPASEFDSNITNLDSKVDQTLLSKEVKEQNEKMETEGNRIFDEVKANIRKDLPKGEARTLTAVTYGRRIDDIAKRSQDGIDQWIKDYGSVIPSDGGMGNLKIAAVVGAIAYGDTKGNMIGRLKNAAVWGAGAAAITHPVLTGGLAGIMTLTGKTVLAPVIGVGIPNFIFALIDNPRSIERALRKSARKQTSIDSTPIYQLLAKGETQRESLAKEFQSGSQNAFELRSKGLQINDDNLNKVMTEIEQYEKYQRLGQPRTFDSDRISNAATFILQMAEHTLNEVELYEFRKAMWNKEASPEMIRRVLATNAEKAVLSFFEKNEMMSQLETEMSTQTQKGVTPPAKADLSKIFVDGTVDAGSSEFVGGNQKHGVRRFLSMGGGGMALALYAIAFLGLTGIMKIKKLAHPDTWTKTAPKLGKKVMSFALAPLTALGTLVKKRKAKGMLRQYRKAKPEPFTKTEQSAIWKKMTTEDKKTLIAQTKDFVKKEKKENDKKFKYDELPLILKSKLVDVKKEALPEKK